MYSLKKLRHLGWQCSPKEPWTNKASSTMYETHEFSWLVVQVDPQTQQHSQSIAAALGWLPEFGRKTLSLKKSHPCDTGLGGNDLELASEPRPCWLALAVLEDSMDAAKGEMHLVVPLHWKAYEPQQWLVWQDNYNCVIVAPLFRLPTAVWLDLRAVQQEQKEFMPRTVNLANYAWREET